MAWVNWSRKSGADLTGERGSLGIELNASRARATTGKASRNRVLLLEDPHADLPQTISLEKRTAEVGRAGTALLRRMPHLTCSSFLPCLGRSQEWKGGRHSLNVSAALTLTFEKLRASCPGFANIFLGLPAYLTLQQVNKLALVAGKHRFPLKGTVVAPLAVAANRAAALLA